MAKSPKKAHRYEWLVELLGEDPTLIRRPMFGCLACYIRGKMVFMLAALDEEPWNGVLVTTSREHHESLLADFPALTHHSILGKWLYLPEASDEFEETAAAMAERILRGDDRFGIVGSEGKKKKAKSTDDVKKPRPRPRDR